MIQDYIWKYPKVVCSETIEQDSKRMIDMNEYELKTAYEHCKRMLYNDDFNYKGRYLIIEEINKQLLYCTAESAVRWFLTLKHQGRPIYTRYDLVTNVNAFWDKSFRGTKTKQREITIDHIFQELPTTYQKIPIDVFLQACKDTLGKINTRYIKPSFLYDIGIWFTPQETKEFQQESQCMAMVDIREYVKTLLKIPKTVELPLRSTGLNYLQFRSIYNLAVHKNKKYSDLTTVQLETLKDKVLFLLQDKIYKHINMWETLMSQIEEVCQMKNYKL
jgi:hypothetical protein